ncbi:hypothetical protein KEM55_007575, partial [Ascosphaera atra]
DDNHQQAQAADQAGTAQSSEASEEQGHRPAANTEDDVSNGAFEQFQPAPEVDPFQQGDPLAAAAAPSAGIEAPITLPSATAVAGEADIDGPETTAPTSEQAASMTSESDDEEESTLPAGFALAPGTTKPHEKRTSNLATSKHERAPKGDP